MVVTENRIQGTDFSNQCFSDGVMFSINSQWISDDTYIVVTWCTTEVFSTTRAVYIDNSEVLMVAWSLVGALVA